MPQQWFTVRAQAEAKAVQVSIRGIIGEWGLSDREFIRDVEAAGDDVELIEVTINSRGGEVDHGLAIYNFLKAHSAAVSVRIDGIAASAASVIALAGDEIIMPENTLMMVHNPWTFAAGNAKQLRKTADDLEKFEQSLMSTYMGRTNKSEDEVRSLLNEETWLTAAEAVELGFADKVESLKRSATAALAEAVDIPEAVLARIQAAGDSTPEPSNDDDSGATGDDDSTPEQDPPAEPGTDPEASTQPPAPGGSKPNGGPAADKPDPAALAELCSEHGLNTMAASWIREGLTVAAAKQRILEIKAAVDDALQVQGQLVPAGADEEPDGGIKASWSDAFSKNQVKRGNW